MSAVLYPKVDHKEWANQYGIDINFSSPCIKCGEKQRFTIPFAFEKFRGLLSDHQSCGEEFRQSIMTPADDELNEGLKQFIEFMGGGE